MVTEVKSGICPARRAIEGSREVIRTTVVGMRKDPGRDQRKGVLVHVGVKMTRGS
jgi:hypothetical protein